MEGEPLVSRPLRSVRLPGTLEESGLSVKPSYYTLCTHSLLYLHLCTPMYTYVHLCTPMYTYVDPSYMHIQPYTHLTHL